MHMTTQEKLADTEMLNKWQFLHYNKYTYKLFLLQIFCKTLRFFFVLAICYLANYYSLGTMGCLDLDLEDPK